MVAMDVVITVLVLILSVNLVFTENEKLQVILFPKYPLLYVSDEVTLRCQKGTNINKVNVTWFFKNKLQSSTNGYLHFDFLTKENSGMYSCKMGTEESEIVEINVLDMLPLANLSIRQGKHVILKGGAVLMDLYVEEGLGKEEWRCRYTQNNLEYLLGLNDKWSNNNRSVTIHGEVHEPDNSAIYWCVNKAMTKRSNAITLKASESIVMLQALDPGLVGEKLSLLCEVWGTTTNDVTFFKNGTSIYKGQNKHTIDNVKMSDTGSYKCTATYSYTHLDKNAAVHSGITSDVQVLHIRAGPPKAKLEKENEYLRCSCPEMPSDVSYEWYWDINGSQVLDETWDILYPAAEGVYKCRAKWKDVGVSRFSPAVYSNAGKKPDYTVHVLVVFVVLVIFLVIIIVLRLWNKRGSSGKKLEDGEDGGYEAMPMKGKGDYEELKGQETKIYQTLKEQGQGEGEYEALKSTQADVYNTLKGEGKAEGEGGYEALKLAQAEVYHTLKTPGESKAEGDGGYEALKLAQTEVYHTLKAPGESKAEGEGGYEALKIKAEGEGGYEALKLAQADVYHTLKGQGEQKADGDGGYEALKLTQGDVYQTLKDQVESKSPGELKPQVTSEDVVEEDHAKIKRIGSSGQNETEEEKKKE